MTPAELDALIEAEVDAIADSITDEKAAQVQAVFAPHLQTATPEPRRYAQGRSA